MWVCLWRLGDESLKTCNFYIFSFSNKVLAQRIQSSDTDLTQVDLYIADIKDGDEELKELIKRKNRQNAIERK